MFASPAACCSRRFLFFLLGQVNSLHLHLCIKTGRLYRTGPSSHLCGLVVQTKWEEMLSLFLPRAMDAQGFNVRCAAQITPCMYAV